jgi:hypothetical protein
MTPRTSRTLWLGVAAITSAVVGCSSDQRPTAPSAATQSAALAIAATFHHMGDSVVAEHGDSDAANRFYGAAAVLRRIPVFDTITITIDSQPMMFNAVALAVEDTGAVGACLMPPMDDDRDGEFECPRGLRHPTHTLFAWQPGHPPHIVELVATSDSSSIGLPGRWHWEMGTSDSMTTVGDSTFRIPARLKYFAGSEGRGIFWGSEGTQMNTLQASGDACPTPTDTTAADSTSADRDGSGDGGHDGHDWDGIHINAVSCQTAAFTFQFSATVRRPPVSWWDHNTASGTHTISLDASTVPGALVTLSIAVDTTHHD